MKSLIQYIFEKHIFENIDVHDKDVEKILQSDKYHDKKTFLKYSRQKRKETGKTDPSTEFQFIRYINDEWCVHFCDSKTVDEINKHGFKYGTKLETIPYGFGGKQKEKGYNYGFLIEDVASKDPDTDCTRFWGYNAVIFKCSGVLGYHRGDKNRQVIFWCENAHDIMPIHQGNTNDGANCCNLIDKNGNILYQFYLTDFNKLFEWLKKY